MVAIAHQHGAGRNMKKNFLHPPKIGENRTKRASAPGERRGCGNAR
jgi:hypothetical protein